MALEFDGVNDYASLGTAGFPFARLPQTISFWLNPGRGAAEQTIMTLNKDAESGVLLGLSNGVPTARSAYSGDVFVQASSALPSGEWHHLAYLFDGTDAAPHHTLYVDGKVVGTGTLLPDKRTPNTAYMGSDNHEERCYGGLLDEVRVWAVARSPELIRAELAGEALEQEPPELVLYYTFDEAAGARVVDRSGRQNHALLGDGLDDYMPRRVLSGVVRARAALGKP
ncbi:MAG TPA: LamG domain-containing protein [Polyangiaceae bacterium]|nr:LamG domain-containing protein [Polyangiaceae bacterium]